MKKKTKFLCMILAFAMTLTTLSASLVSADTSETYITLYPSKDAKVKKLYSINNDTATTLTKNQNYLTIYASNVKKLYTVNSSDTSALSVNKKKSKLNQSLGSYAAIYCTAKKTGTATVTIKAGKTKKKAKTISQTVKIVKYTNPLKSLKLGGKKISGSKFNKTSVLKLKYSDYANKSLSLGSLKLKKNWLYASGCALVTPSGSGYKAVYLDTDSSGNLKSLSNGSLTPIKITQKGSWIELDLWNTENGQNIKLTILFK